MKNKMHNSIEMNINDLESITNLNQSFNENNKQKKILPEINKTWIENLKNLPLISIIFLIIFPIIFIIIGIIYRNSCIGKPDLPIFLIIFGILILVNLFIYTIIGATFLACKIYSYYLLSFFFFMKIYF